MKQLALHQGELEKSLEVVAQKIEQSESRDHPFSFAKFLWESLCVSSDLQDFTCRLGKSNRARNAHDFYGWMSKSGRLGECKGAIYRSEQYMKIALASRSGKRKLKRRGEAYSANDVHIEHSIPVAVILEAIWFERPKFMSASNEEDVLEQLHKAFLTLSVCTALTRKEEAMCILKNFKKKHPQFEGGRVLVPSIAEVHPFARYDYSDGLRIFEVITGAEINPAAFTLADHKKLIDEAGIYELRSSPC